MGATPCAPGPGAAQASIPSGLASGASSGPCRTRDPSFRPKPPARCRCGPFQANVLSRPKGLVPTLVSMDWKTRFPVGLALLAALMLAGGVSTATSMKLASAHGKATLMASHDGSQDSAESDDPGESEPPAESEPPEESEPSDESNSTEGDALGVQGDSVERFHEGCGLPAGAPALDGNWTHGQYVSAFASAGDREAHPAAAHNDCGKPMKATGHAKKEKDVAHGTSSDSHGKGGHHGKNHRS